MPGYKTAGTGKNIKGADNSEWYYGKLQIIRQLESAFLKISMDNLCKLGYVAAEYY